MENQRLKPGTYLLIGLSILTTITKQKNTTKTMNYSNIVKHQISTTAQNLSQQKHDIQTHHSLEVLEALVKPETPKNRMEELDKEDKIERFKSLVDIANNKILVNEKRLDLF